MNFNAQDVASVTAFLGMEADMLDHKEYDDWLTLWSETGLYIVPVDHTKNDYKNSLNIAYDDSGMRQMRTARLQSGEAVSTQIAGTTIRTLSRVRILDEEDNVLRVRCAYCLYENKKGGLRSYPADVQFKLRRDGETFKIEEKVVKLLGSNDYLATVSYLF